MADHAFLRPGSDAAGALAALDRDLMDFITGAYAGDAPTGAAADRRFNELFLRLFEYQFEHNRPYQKLCRKRGRTPANVTRWQEVPAVTAATFRELTLTTFPVEEAVRTVMTSGTTSGRPGKIHHNALGAKYWHVAKGIAGARALCPSRERKQALLLTLPPSVAPHSALSHGVSSWVSRCTRGEPRHFLAENGLLADELVAELRAAEERGEPVLLAGATFGFVHFFDHCRERGIAFRLPPESVLAEGGGFKGKSREVKKEDFFAMAEEVLGLPREDLVNVYGLSEVSTVFPDTVHHDKWLAAVSGRPAGEVRRRKQIAPWTRIQLIDPETDEPAAPGKVGVIRHACLANICTVLAVQTDDVGYLVEGGFEVLGRAQGAEARGCSIAVDELLQRKG